MLIFLLLLGISSGVLLLMSGLHPRLGERLRLWLGINLLVVSSSLMCMVLDEGSLAKLVPEECSGMVMGTGWKVLHLASVLARFLKQKLGAQDGCYTWDSIISH